VTRKAATAAARRGPGLWVQGLLCGALVTLATPTAVLAGVLLLPAVIVHLMDTTEGRPILRTVLLFGLPLLVRLALEAQSKLEVAGLRSQRDRLATEWGLPAAGAATDEAVDSPKTR